jgi:uncharacterized damage-inducible protein DinB
LKKMFKYVFAFAAVLVTGLQMREVIIQRVSLGSQSPAQKELDSWGAKKMTSAEREFTLKGLDDSREHLLGALQRLSREQLEYRPSADRWSVAECVEHIILVEKYVLKGLEGLVKQPPDTSKHSDWEGRDVHLVKRVAERVNRLKAPEGFRPNGRWPIEKLAAEFEPARAQSREFVGSLEGDLRSRVYLHPALGEIDAYQFILFIVGHCDRHRAQSEEVMSTPGFPRQSETRVVG